MIDSTTGRLKSKVYSGTGGQIVSGTKRRIGESISAIVATEKTPIVLNQRSDHTLSSILKEEGISSLMCIPLEAKGKLIGVFNINRVSGMDFTKDDLKFFTTVGAQAAIAIEESILYQSIEEKVRQLNIFHKVGQALISTFGLQQMLDLIVKAISQLMHTKRCSLRLLADDTHRTIITASCGLSETYCCNEGAVLDGKIMEHIIHKKTPIAIKDIQIDSRISNHECIIQEGLRSLLSVPLIMRDEVLGIVTVYSSEIYEYTKEEIELLSTFAAQAAIAIENTQLFEATRRELFKVAADLAEAIDQRDGYDKNHTTAMVEYCVKVAKKLRLPPEQIESIKISALLHDIGKLCIPENILLKKGNLTQEEQKLIKKHTLFGTEIIEKINLPWNIKEAILQHHERIDGKGYPDGVIGNEINMEALIIEVVEAYEAMITRRPYREALSREKAIEELKRCSGKEFEPKVVDAFLEVLQEEEKQ
jgi:putative nucleotidyltransferase with HDIG domain